ncbi:MAG TPA: sugar phosphate isomerase/epimerase [Ktedonobacterales bacterium]|jgi:sugar phosphate isomerase/epimerase
MRISFSTATFYARSLGYSLRLARDAGFDGVELALGVGYQLRGPQHYLRAIRADGVPALSVHPPFLRLRVLGWPLAVTRRMTNLTAAAHLVDAPICVAHVPSLGSMNSRRAVLFERAIALGYDAAPGNVTISLESTQYAGTSPRLLDDIATLVAYAGAHNCGVTLDTCHVGANGEDLLAVYEVVRPLLKNVHLSDARHSGQHVRTHIMPGEGELPLRELLATMARDGYDGLITLELHPREVGFIGRKRNLERLRQAREFVQSALGAETATLSER